MQAAWAPPNSYGPFRASLTHLPTGGWLSPFLVSPVGWQSGPFHKNTLSINLLNTRDRHSGASGGIFLSQVPTGGSEVTSGFLDPVESKMQ